MSRDPGAAVIDYGKPPDRRRRRRWLMILAVTLSVVLGGIITTVQVRRELAQRAALLQAQQIAQERARLSKIFAAQQKELAELEAQKAQLEAERVQRVARRRAATRAASEPATLK